MSNIAPIAGWRKKGAGERSITVMDNAKTTTNANSKPRLWRLALMLFIAVLIGILVVAAIVGFALLILKSTGNLDWIQPTAISNQP